MSPIAPIYTYIYIYVGEYIYNIYIYIYILEVQVGRAARESQFIEPIGIFVCVCLLSVSAFCFSFLLLSLSLSSFVLYNNVRAFKSLFVFLKLKASLQQYQHHRSLGRRLDLVVRLGRRPPRRQELLPGCKQHLPAARHSIQCVLQNTLKA